MTDSEFLDDRDCTLPGLKPCPFCGTRGVRLINSDELAESFGQDTYDITADANWAVVCDASTGLAFLQGSADDRGRGGRTMSLREAAQALIDDYDSIEPEEGSYKVAWPQMEALRDALAEEERKRKWVMAAAQAEEEAGGFPPVGLAALAEAEKAEPTAWRIYDHESALGGGIWITDSERDAVEAKQAGCVVIGLVEQQAAPAHPPAALPESAKAESAELTTEQIRALRESHAFDAEWRYFEPRPVSDSAMSRKAFSDGFERGWDAALAAARGKG